MKEIQKDIEIAAPTGHVWRILMDFPSFPEWNPFVLRIEGETKQGARLDVVLKLPGKKEMHFKPKVLVIEPEKEFRWIGHLGVPGIFDGEHIFSIESLSDQKVRFVQKEKFKGIMASILFHSIKDATKQAFEEMNGALKERAELMKNKPS